MSQPDKPDTPDGSDDRSIASQSLRQLQSMLPQDAVVRRAMVSGHWREIEKWQADLKRIEPFSKSVAASLTNPLLPGLSGLASLQGRSVASLSLHADIFKERQAVLDMWDRSAVAQLQRSFQDMGTLHHAAFFASLQKQQESWRALLPSLQRTVDRLGASGVLSSLINDTSGSFVRSQLAASAYAKWFNDHMDPDRYQRIAEQFEKQLNVTGSLEVFEAEDMVAATAALKDVHASPPKISGMREFFETLVAAIAKQPDETTRALMALVVHKMVEWLCSAIVGFYVGQWMMQVQALAPRQAVKVIKEEARKEIEPLELLSEFRVVRSKTLVLRLNPNIRSPALGSLQLGAVVQLVRKDSDFSLVVWQDQASGYQIQGWVLNRYLVRLY